MIHRVAIFAGSLAAALGLAVGLVIAGIAPGAAPVEAQTAAAPGAAAGAPAPVVQVDTVYVTPAATPQDIVITRVVKAAPQGDDGPDEQEGADD